MDAIMVPPQLRRPGERLRDPKPGSWKYERVGKSRWTLWVGIAFSATFHLVALLGFNRHAPPVKRVFIDETQTIALVMPDLKDLEEPEKQISDADEPPVDAGVSVPTLADVPTHIDLSNSFVQQIDYSTLVAQPDLSAVKSVTIPTHISRAPKLDGTKIFELKELDRAPQPVVQITPTIPTSLKQAGTRLEATVLFVVDTNGAVQRAEVTHSSDYKFNDAVLTAIAKWKFRPGMKSGRRVNVRMIQPFIVNVVSD